MTIFLVPVFAVAHRDELRKVFVEGPQSIVHPSAQGREIAIVLMASGMELGLRSMVRVGRPHRANDRKLIDLGSDMREPVADLDPALAVLLESDLEWIQSVALVSVPIGHNEPLDSEFLGVLGFCKGRFCDRLSCILRKHRFWVEALHMADPSVHEQPDHTLGFRGSMGFAVRGKPILVRVCKAIPLEHRAEGKPGKSHPHVGQEVSSLGHSEGTLG